MTSPRCAGCKRQHSRSQHNHLHIRVSPSRLLAAEVGFDLRRGIDELSNLPPGTYSLELRALGFKRASTSDLTVVDASTLRDVQLEVGAVSETVDVTSAAEATTTSSDARLGNSFERKRITELPLNASNVVGLRSLQPDVSRTGSVNGERDDQSGVTLDGVDVRPALRVISLRGSSWIPGRAQNSSNS
jgi:hypothetical protein